MLQILDTLALVVRRTCRVGAEKIPAGVLIFENSKRITTSAALLFLYQNHIETIKL